MLDMIAAMLSGGAATHQIPADPEREAGVSQVFLAFNVASFGNAGGGNADRLADSIVASIAEPVDGEPGGHVRYPGEQVLRTRAENLKLGVPIDPEVWREVKGLGRLP
jgi:3-dehydro-L-gulonate 2-dehydrogenase